MRTSLAPGVLFCSGVLLMLAPLSYAAPPKVIRCAPEPGDQQVDPHTRFIRVEFDQDMAEGNHSWVGGGENYPKIRGRPYWEGPRIAVLPVELRPDRDYALRVNSETFRSFRSRAGESVKPYPIEFHTGETDQAIDAQNIARQENKAAVPVLRRTIDRWYSYRDLRGVDWDKVFAEHAPQFESAASPADFAKRAGELLAVARDLHIFLECEGQRFASHTRAISPNANIETLRRLVPQWNKRSKRVVSGKFPDGIGYILIATWEPQYRQDLATAYEALDDLADAKGLIIDVRFNAGGDEPLAQEFAGCFVAGPVVYGRNVYRAPDEPSGVTEPLDRVVRPTKGRPKYRGKVAVLTGPYVMSSCESFLLMMKQARDCKLVGAASYGSSGNPQGYGLPNGVVVFLPSWRDMRPDGSGFEGKGIPPDIEVNADTTDFESADPVLDAALRWLRGAL